MFYTNFLNNNFLIFRVGFWSTKWLLPIITLCIFTASKADKIKNAYKYLEKGEYDKARSILDKELAHDTLNAGADYLYAVYYMSVRQSYSLDSAYVYIRKAERDFPKAHQREWTEWKEVGIKLESIKAFKNKLEQLAFEYAHKNHSISAYMHFLSWYHDSNFATEAKYRRNALAWYEATSQNTIEGYDFFLEKFADAEKYNEALQKRDYLVWVRETKYDKTIAGQKFFLEKYPKSTARFDAEYAIFQYSTASHQVGIYKNFLKQFPDNLLADKALEWLLVLENEPTERERSLQKIKNEEDRKYWHDLFAIEKEMIIPTFIDGNYGFINVDGKALDDFPPNIVPVENPCEAIQSSFFVVKNDEKYGLMDKLGNTLLDTKYDYIEYFDHGLYKVIENNLQGLYHCGGYDVFAPVYDKIDILSNQLVRIQKNNKAGLASMNGCILLDLDYEDLHLLNQDFVKVLIDNHWRLIALKQLYLSFYNNEKRDDNPPYEEVAPFNGHWATGSDSQHKDLLSVDGKIIFKTEVENKIKKTGFGFAVEIQKDQWLTYYPNGQRHSQDNYQKIENNPYFTVLKKMEKWALLDTLGNFITSFDYDSISTLQNFAFLEKDDKTYIYLSKTKEMKNLDNFISVELIESNHQPDKKYLKLNNVNGLETLLDDQANVLFPSKYQQLYPLEDNYFSGKKDNQYFLVNEKGKEILPRSFKGISRVDSELLAVMNDDKFGLYNIQNKNLIPCNYKYVPLKLKNATENYYIVTQDDLFGLINEANEWIVPMDFPKIESWNDQMVLVQNFDNQWQFFDIKNKKLLEEEVFEDFEVVSDTKDEKIAIMHHWELDLKAIWSNKFGELIDIEHEQITNIGTSEKPVFMAQKFLKKKNLYNIDYINAIGKIIFHQQFNETEYNQINCR